MTGTTLPRDGYLSAYLEQVRKIAGDVASREGCQLYDVEMVGSGAGRILRVFIEKDVAGASLEDCTNVSRGINLLLDVEDPIPGGAYHLEVSTPGLERILRQPWHFERAVGKVINVKSFSYLLDFNQDQPDLGKAKQVTGVLKNTLTDGVQVEPEVALASGQMVFVPYSSIAKANQVFRFDELAAHDPHRKSKGHTAKNPKQAEKHKK